MFEARAQSEEKELHCIPAGVLSVRDVDTDGVIQAGLQQYARVGTLTQGAVMHPILVARTLVPHCPAETDRCPR